MLALCVWICFFWGWLKILKFTDIKLKVPIEIVFLFAQANFQQEEYDPEEDQDSDDLEDDDDDFESDVVSHLFWRCMHNRYMTWRIFCTWVSLSGYHFELFVTTKRS